MLKLEKKNLQVSPLELFSHMVQESIMLQVNVEDIGPTIWKPKRSTSGESNASSIHASNASIDIIESEDDNLFEPDSMTNQETTEEQDHQCMNVMLMIE